MNKIEEIINKVDEDFYKENSYYLSYTEPEKFAKQVAINFGKLAFEAGNNQYWDDGGTGCLEFKYYEYEDFLKEIENESKFI